MAKRHTNEIGNLESLFLRLEELVLANSGEDEFEEVFKLLIAKLWDESSNGCEFRVHSTDHETKEAIGALLRNAENGWPGILDETTSRLLPEHLEVCVDALQAHTLSNAGLEVMDGFFEFMVAKASKGSKGQYFTPRHVIEMCVRMLKPKPSETVLDPACGSGGFLVHALNNVRPQLNKTSVSEYSNKRLWGFDMDGRAIRVAKALMVLAGDGAANIVRLNSLLQPGMTDLFEEKDSALIIEDVVRSRLRRHKGFDLILTNPPFAGEVRERQLLDGYDVGANKKRVERDVLFVERCINLLRPGGRLAIVLPHNKFAAASCGFLREWLMGKARVLAVIGLGRNTFLPHTHQKASVLLLQKDMDEESHEHNDYKIFFAISEKDGKTSKGQFVFNADDGDLWERVNHDFVEIVDGFSDFCKTEGLEI